MKKFDVCAECEYDECTDSLCLGRLMVVVEEQADRIDALEEMVKELLKAHVPTLCNSCGDST